MYGIQDWERSREVRLGLVMYGGVSLAVYENGVAQELHRAVRGEGIYGLIKELIDSDIIVDIVSGTSAGGINGILLSHAIANNRRFADSAKLWREDGDILRLMRSTNDPSTASLLDSEGYYQPRLQQAFQKMTPYDESENSPYQSEVKELDLFVTGTDIDGNVYTVFDDQGHAIDVRDHKAVFQLSYRKDREKNEFDVIKHPVAAEALAKLSRVTSCFPVAFAPVSVTNSVDREEADGLLQSWGKLGRSANFLDGGVLDNKPFSYTIEAIFSRSADRDVNRYLLYVEPDPERFQKNHPKNPPNVLEAAMKALIAIPGYESISADLADINERNRKLALQEELADCVRKDVRWNLGDSCLRGNTDAQEAGMKAVAESDPVRFAIYRQSRLAQLRDRALMGILKNKGNTQWLQDEQREQAELLVKAFGELGMGYLQKNAPRLEDLDVYFRIRRLFHLIYFIKGILWDRPGSRDMSKSQQGACRDLWRHLNHMVQVLEIIRYYMEYMVDEVEISFSSMAASDREDERRQKAFLIWGKVNNCMKQLLLSDGIVIPELAKRDVKGDETKAQRDELNKAARRSRDAFAKLLRVRATKAAATAGEAPFEGRILLQETDLMERDLLLAFEGQVPKEILDEYCRFPHIDSHLFPTELVSGIHAKDRIRTVRLSPIDAKRGLSDQTLADKLCGDQLGHFSGFLKRSWRSNDIMWGRIDTVCQLTECLLTREKVEQACKWPSFAANILPSKLFPHSSDEVNALLDTEIRQLSSWAKKGGPDEEDNKARFDAFLSRFVLAAQREVFAEEAPKIVEDAIGQQVEWNQYAMPIVEREASLISPQPSINFDPTIMGWRTGKEKIDPVLTTVGSEQLATMALGGKQLENFLAKYKVGQESFQDDIPRTVLYEIIFHAAVVLQKCVLAAFPENLRKKIEANWLYLLGLHYPIQFFHSFTRFLRRAPELSKVLVSVSLAVSVGLLTVGIYFRKYLLFDGEDLSLPGAAVFLLFPIGMLAGLYFLLCGYRVRRPGSGVNWFYALKVVAVAAGSIAVLSFLGSSVAVAFGFIRPDTLNGLPTYGWSAGWQGYLIRLAENRADYWITAIPAFLLAAAAPWLIRRDRRPKPSLDDLKAAILFYIPTKVLAELAAGLGVAVTPPPPFTGAFTTNQREDLAAAILLLDRGLVQAKIRQCYPGALPW